MRGRDRAAARTDFIEDRSSSRRDSGITFARRSRRDATAAEPIAPVAPVTTTVGMIYE